MEGRQGNRLAHCCVEDMGVVEQRRLDCVQKCQGRAQQPLLWRVFQMIVQPAREQRPVLWGMDDLQQCYRLRQSGASLDSATMWSYDIRFKALC